MLTLLFSLAHAGPASATIATVLDGDSYVLDSGEHIQLRGVVAPSTREDYGIEARELVRVLIGEGEVFLTYPEDEGTKRASVQTLEGDLASSLLEQGFAYLSMASPEDIDLTMLSQAQQTARSARRGIWGTARFAGELHIAAFVANAEGDDRENVNGESLTLCNIGAQPLSLDGYTLRDKGGNIWALPPMAVPVGHSVVVRSGVGTNQTDSTAAMVVYLGSDRPIWNNTDDQATLMNRAGRVVDAVQQRR